MGNYLLSEIDDLRTDSMYHCKKCGAVVTGKYCSCCGKRVTTDFEDFRAAERRTWRNFDRRKRELDGRKYNMVVVTQAAKLAQYLAQDKTLPKEYMTVSNFHLVSDVCWKSLALLEMCAEADYANIMEICYPGYKENQHERTH